MRLGTIVCVVLLGAAQLCVADIAETMSYQGVLNEASTGSPVEDGTYVFTFRIYDALTGGTLEWVGSDTLFVESGIFNAILGENEPLDLPFDEPYWLSTEVDEEGELEPRVELASAPYAFRAKYADVADDGDWVVDGDNIYRLDGRVGLGTQDPELLLTLEKATDTSFAPRLRLKANANQLYGTAQIQLVKSRGTVVGSEVTTQDGDQLGLIDGYGYDSANGISKACRIAFMQDGDAGAYVPGQIRLATSDGTAVSESRVTIVSNGNVGIGTEDPAAKLHIAGVPGSDGILFPDGTLQVSAGGDIDGVVAGDGLSGGGTSGSVTLDVTTGTGLTISSDAVALTSEYSTGSAHDDRFVNEGQANSVATGMIQNSAVTTAKVADDAVTGGKLAHDIDASGIGFNSDTTDGNHVVSFDVSTGTTTYIVNNYWLQINTTGTVGQVRIRNPGYSSFLRYWYWRNPGTPVEGFLQSGQQILISGMTSGSIDIRVGTSSYSGDRRQATLMGIYNPTGTALMGHVIYLE